MIGDGPTKDDLVRKAKEMNLSNLTFYDRRPKKEMPGILASLDVSLIPLAGRFPGTMPSKIYEAFASGTPPIVAKGCEGETLITQFEAGRCYEPGDNNEMAAAIRELAENTTLLQQIRNNCAELSKRFDRDAIARRTEKILVAITEGTTLPEIRW